MKQFNDVQPIVSRMFLSAEVAAHFRAHPETIRRKLREQVIIGIKVGRGWRVTQKEVERLTQGGGL